MYKSLSYSHNLLIRYLQTLNDAELWQILYFAHWKKVSYSSYIRNFLVQQQKDALEQHATLKSLENTLNIHLSGGKCEPIRALLHEMEKTNRFVRKNADLAETILIRQLKCIKHYEQITYQTASALAHKLEEAEVAHALASIVMQEKQAYLQLQNFVDHPQNGKVDTNTMVK